MDVCICEWMSFNMMSIYVWSTIHLRREKERERAGITPPEEKRRNKKEKENGNGSVA